jgi:hypothetical protein
MSFEDFSGLFLVVLFEYFPNGSDYVLIKVLLQRVSFYDHVLFIFKVFVQVLTNTLSNDFWRGGHLLEIHLLEKN